MNNTNLKKVIVGMSGGVDSSVSAWLLKQQGYQVEGLFMKNWETNHHESLCTALTDLSDAYAVCKSLNIHLHTVNFAKEYWNNVFQKFIEEYKIGLTPNPDILCNEKIKFECFLKFAINNLNADFIATGHHVRQIYINNQNYLIRGVDKNKDQSYFLHTLSYKKLKYCLFPIGIFTKLQVRNIAKKLNLITANKKDSTGICFIGKRRFSDFLKNYIPINPGLIINTDGKKVGTHQGIAFYTLGQRKGLKIGGTKKSTGKPWYVVDKNVKNNTLIVVQGKNHPCLMSNKFYIKQTRWITRTQLKSILQCTVKTRYRQLDVQCHVYPTKNNNFKIILKRPILAITPGQSAVFYLKERCLGGGIITNRQSLMKTYNYK